MKKKKPRVPVSGLGGVGQSRTIAAVWACESVLRNVCRSEPIVANAESGCSGTKFTQSLYTGKRMDPQKTSWAPLGTLEHRPYLLGFYSFFYEKSVSIILF